MTADRFAELSRMFKQIKSAMHEAKQAGDTDLELELARNAIQVKREMEPYVYSQFQQPN